MLHQNLFEQLGNRNSPLVREALTRTCEVCGSPPNAVCTGMPINGFPLQNRIVHYGRTREQRARSQQPNGEGATA